MNDHEAEAERLALLPREEQLKALQIIRAPADNPKLSQADRDEARTRADMLDKILKRLNRTKRK